MTKCCSAVPDKDLVKAASLGSEVAFKELYEKYWGNLYKLAYRRLPSEEDVKDLLQETFISLWKKLPYLSVDESIGGYLYVSLQRKIFNHYEKHQLQCRKLMKQPIKPVQSENNIYNSIYTKELKAVISAVIEGMPPKMKVIYLLRKERSNAEIATLLMIALQTVKNQAHQATLRIRSELKRANLHQ